MPPATKRNASIILFDCNVGQEFLIRAKKCLMDICAKGGFSQRKDLTKLILVNCEETLNPLAARLGDGKFSNIYEATDVIYYNLKKILNCIQDIHKAQGNWLDGLLLGIDSLKNNFHEMRGIVTLQLLFITDLTTPAKYNERKVETIIHNLDLIEAYLYIIGPQVIVPQMLSSFTDIQKWMADVKFVEEANPNIPIVKRIVQETKNSIVCDTMVGTQLFTYYRNYAPKQPWLEPLSFGSRLQIPTSTSRYLQKGKFIVGKKQKTPQSEPWKWVNADDVTDTIDYSNVVSGITRHGKLIPLSEDVKMAFKFSGPRCFKVFGFADLKHIPEYYIRGESYSVVFNERNPHSEAALYSLVQNTHKLKKCIIARRVYMNNSKPRLVILIPDIERNRFVLAELPYADDFRMSYTKFRLASAPELQVAADVKKVSYDYLDELDVSDNRHKDENGSAKIPLSIELRDSIKYQVASHKILQTSFVTDGSDTEPTMDIFDVQLADDATCQCVITKWPERELESTYKKRPKGEPDLQPHNQVDQPKDDEELPF